MDGLGKSTVQFAFRRVGSGGEAQGKYSGDRHLVPDAAQRSYSEARHSTIIPKVRRLRAGRLGGNVVYRRDKKNDLLNSLSAHRLGLTISAFTIGTFPPVHRLVANFQQLGVEVMQDLVDGVIMSQKRRA
jgi:hypothetical protein